MPRKYQPTNWMLQTGRHSEFLVVLCLWVFSFPKHFGTLLSLGLSSLNWWTPTPYRKSTESGFILSITSPDLSPVQPFGINDRPLPTQSQGMGSPYVKSRNWPMGYRRKRRRWPTRWHTIQEIRAAYYYYAVDDQWCAWRWSVVEARRIWRELWGRIIERCIDVAHRTLKSVYCDSSISGLQVAGYEQYIFDEGVLLFQINDGLVTRIMNHV